VLAGGDGGQRHGGVVGIGVGDEHRVHVGLGDQLLIITEALAHPPGVANRVEHGLADVAQRGDRELLAKLCQGGQVNDLAHLAAADYSDSKLLHIF
jgi:hypothetical protein